jgi:hypothetical protein
MRKNKLKMEDQSNIAEQINLAVRYRKSENLFVQDQSIIVYTRAGWIWKSRCPLMWNT